MRLKKYIVKILSVISIFLLSTTGIYAYEDGSIVIEPIFNETQGLWQPGKVESKEFYIKNNKNENITIDKIYLSLDSSTNYITKKEININSLEFNELARNTIVNLSYQGDALFQGKLDKLLSENGIVLYQELNIKSNEKLLLNMTMKKDGEMGNYAQSLENIFNIGVAYKIDDNKPIKPKPPNEQPNKNPDSSLNPDKEVGSGSNKLPQTGGIINSTSLMMFGLAAIGIGFVLNKNASKEKGGKHHE